MSNAKNLWANGCRHAFSSMTYKITLKQYIDTTSRSGSDSEHVDCLYIFYFFNNVLMLRFDDYFICFGGVWAFFFFFCFY